LDKVTETEWKVLESKTKGTPKNLWKCKNCNNASVILDPLDGHVHGEYAARKKNSNTHDAYIPLLNELKDIVMAYGRGGDEESRLAEYVARQDLHAPQLNVTVVLDANNTPPVASTASASFTEEDDDLDWEDV
jgi:hypothetical protein